MVFYQTLSQQVVCADREMQCYHVYLSMCKGIHTEGEEYQRSQFSDGTSLFLDEIT